MIPENSVYWFWQSGKLADLDFCGSKSWVCKRGSV